MPRPTLFVILGGFVFVAWGDIYSLFPSICPDCYGTKYGTANAGLLWRPPPPWNPLTRESFSFNPLGRSTSLTSNLRYSLFHLCYMVARILSAPQ